MPNQVPSQITAINSYEYLFPVVGCDVDADARISVQRVYGTAFCISGDYFLSASHVLNSASAHRLWGLCYTDDNIWRFTQGLERESLESIDVGIVRASLPGAKTVGWSSSELAMLSEVQAIGFPYALDSLNSRLYIRSFKGHIVSARTWPELPAKPRAYELSFPCPRGLSGSPLWVPGTGSEYHVGGLVVGNVITDMIIDSVKETITDGSNTTLYERVEALHLGLAIQTNEIVTHDSKLLGMSIGEYLAANQLYNVS